MTEKLFVSLTPASVIAEIDLGRNFSVSAMIPTLLVLNIMLLIYFFEACSQGCNLIRLTAYINDNAAAAALLASLFKRK